MTTTTLIQRPRALYRILSSGRLTSPSSREWLEVGRPRHNSVAALTVCLTRVHVGLGESLWVPEITIETPTGRWCRDVKPGDVVRAWHWYGAAIAPRALELVDDYPTRVLVDFIHDRRDRRRGQQA